MFCSPNYRFHILFDALNRGKIRTAVYSDVAIGLGDWAIKQNIDLYVLSNGWKYGSMKFLKKTNHEDLTLLIKDYIDTDAGSLTDPSTFAMIVQKLGLQSPDDALFLTHWGVEGIAAHRAGLSVILVTTHRDDIIREHTEETKKCQLPIIRSFNELIFTHDAPPASTLGSSVDDWSGISGSGTESCPSSTSRSMPNMSNNNSGGSNNGSVNKSKSNKSIQSSSNSKTSAYQSKKTQI